MRELSSEAFRKLLLTLDGEPERSGEKYEGLRRRLIFFFEGRSCGYESEVLADRTIDVVSGKLLEGLELNSSADVSGYCYGVARNLLRDWRKLKKPDPLTTDPRAPEEHDRDSGLRLHCLDRCLDQLAPESRKLILDFYEGERRVKIDSRLRLAHDLGITPNALRRRTHSIRVRLEECVTGCTGGEG